MWAEVKEVAANEVAVHLMAHSILASTLRELKVLKHFLAALELPMECSPEAPLEMAPLELPIEHSPEAPVEIPMCSPVDKEEDYSENLAFEAHIELPGS